MMYSEILLGWMEVMGLRKIFYFGIFDGYRLSSDMGQIKIVYGVLLFDFRCFFIVLIYDYVRFFFFE